MLKVLEDEKIGQGHALVVRFAGDSGDGIQLLGTEFAKSTAEARADFMTFPDFPAEIRAPAGTLFGVSAYQIKFGSQEVLTPGDQADVLVAFNPAALKTNLQHLKRGGLLIADSSTFDARGLKKAKLDASPLEDGTVKDYQLLDIEISKRTLEALSDLDIGRKRAARAKNFWALGLLYWLFGRDLAPTVAWAEQKFSSRPEALEANLAALKAGNAYGETHELSAFQDVSAALAPAHAEKQRVISGTEAMALGISAIAALSAREVVYCSYPITPASALLHALARQKGGVRTFQAEDEIAAACAAIGASYGGALGITASSGPGLSLKTEALGLAVTAELPLIVVDVQRAGPATGMPTKPEQGDLTLAIDGRHGEAPCTVLAPATPGDCFWIMLEAAKIATSTMAPVLVLSDAFLANAAADWEAPDIEALPDLTTPADVPAGEFAPYVRNPETLARPWVPPGTPGLAHRIGGLEKEDGSGHISYDPANHAAMTRLRHDKIARVAERSPAAEIETGADEGELLVVGWGSSHGAIKEAVSRLAEAGHAIAHVHLRQLWPLPQGLETLLSRFRTVVTAELNSGQLAGLLRREYLLPVDHVAPHADHHFQVKELAAELLSKLEAGHE